MSISLTLSCANTIPLTGHSLQTLQSPTTDCLFKGQCIEIVNIKSLKRVFRAKCFVLKIVQVNDAHLSKKHWLLSIHDRFIFIIRISSHIAMPLHLIFDPHVFSYQSSLYIKVSTQPNISIMNDHALPYMTPGEHISLPTIRARYTPAFLACLCFYFLVIPYVIFF